jgi:hypothetical protein
MSLAGNMRKFSAVSAERYSPESNLTEVDQLGQLQKNEKERDSTGVAGSFGCSLWHPELLYRRLW